MEIITLTENKCFDENLESEHGLSLLIKINNKKILFDTGKTDVFIRNAENLNENILDLDYLIISHAHYDHASGMSYLKDKLNKKTKIIVSSDFFHEKYAYRKNEYIYNGIGFKKEDFENYEFIEDNKEYEDFIVFRKFKKYNEIEKIPEFFYRKENNEFIKDCFSDEIVLGLKTKKGIFLISGCSHKGIINIINNIEKDYKINAVLAGAHLKDANIKRIDYTINELKKRNYEKISLMHCTGEKVETLAKASLDNFFVTSVGTRYIE